jgi:hypothetical protein
MSHILSKTTYMRGRQCPKALWLYKNRRELVPPVDPARQAIYDSGTAVGLLAQQLFPGGVDCTPESARDFAPAIEATQRAIAQGATVIYEAAFVHEGVLAALDILVKDDHGWKAYEVKSSSSAKEYQWHDAALQAHVIEGCGIALTDVSIVHLNSAYVRQGPIDVHQLFTITSVKTLVDAERGDVPARIEALKAVLQGSVEPVVGIGPHCGSPFPCDFTAHCWAHVPEEGNVFQLTHARGKDWELYESGILLLKDIPDHEPLSTKQRLQVDGAKHGTTTIEHTALRRWLDELRYPLHHLDFETVMPAVPLFDGTRPFQQLPFQYSLHTQHAAGLAPEHRAFLADGNGDPRPAFVERLLADIGPHGDILAYNASFERTCLKELAHDLPQYAEGLQALVARIKDLHTPFRSGWYTVPEMNGRTSIKVVLPALVQGPAGAGLNYDELAVQEGGTASLLFAQLLTATYPGDTDQLRTDLLAYCALDTLAMVEVLAVLQRTA